ncbi:microcystin degradation protein MlrC [Bosea sp. AK1]|uniref:M81 family metallopeptidase n=1 Tax=Bosea sp. AK1 TaxID=2587160 RepID=UPI0011523134|nr:M81 family metallopeptidase [Bosea sp. AK1]TQI65297.1 microcystin degradation protein MlrC [Bosea sp. AK1]
MRVALASFEFEGNTLSSQVHRRAEFARKVLAEGDDILPAIEGRDLAVAGAWEALRKEGLDVVPVLVAHGGSGGIVEGAFYRETFDKIVAGVLSQPVDGVFLALHGAMICEGENDPEGALIAALREVLGPGVPIAASLDLHAHVTPRMADNADILVGYETYPHIDAYGTGRRAAELLAATMHGRIRPVTRLKRIDALLPVAGGSTNGTAPMAEVRRLARLAESGGRALSASYFPVQPWLDIDDLGIAGVAVSDGDEDAADAVAKEMVLAMWDRRRDFEIPCRSPDDAIREAVRRPGRVLISDAPDCVGGGAPGDAPAVLAALLHAGLEVEAAVLVVDPDVAARAFALGIGQLIRVNVGSALDPRFHPPAEVDGVVESLHDGRFTYSGGISAGTPGNMGPTAVIRAGKLRVVVPTYATYEYGDEQYRAAGVDIGDCRIAVLKNPMNFRTLLDERTSWIMVGGAGPTTPDLASIEWRVKKRPFWPCDDQDNPVFMEPRRDN